MRRRLANARPAWPPSPRGFGACPTKRMSWGLHCQRLGGLSSEKWTIRRTGSASIPREFRENIPSKRHSIDRCVKQENGLRPPHPLEWSKRLKGLCPRDPTNY